MRKDPVQLEIFKNRLTSISEEMGAVLCRSAFSANIKERKDASCAIFNAKGEMIAQAAHIPVHLGSMPLSVLSAIEEQRFEAKDAVLLNDPYRGGTHLPDITVISPVFDRKEKWPSFFVANRAHHSDVGGIQPGSMPASEEIFQEGLRIPPVKIVKQGVVQSDLLNMILSNVRTPGERIGDLQAQLAANRLGIQRLTEIIQNIGNKETQKQARALLDYSEQMMRSVIQKIPDGQYHFFDFLEDDGITSHRIKIKATIRIRKSNAVIDFSGTDLQVKGCVNGPYAVTLSSVFYVFCCLAGFEIPINAGIMRPIEVIAPKGTIVNALPPAAVVGGNVELSQRIVDVLFGALAKALKHEIPSASQGTMNNLTIGGYDPYHQRPFTYYETLAGGMGARPTCDGLDAVHTHMTNTLNTPIEAIEHTFPLRVKAYKIRRGSGGKGRYRGGEGLVRDIEFLSNAKVTILSERRKLAPYGLAGGKPGKKGENFLIRKGKKTETTWKMFLFGPIRRCSFHLYAWGRGVWPITPKTVKGITHSPPIYSEISIYVTI